MSNNSVALVDNCSDIAATAPFLTSGNQTWGLLESIQLGPDDLITVRVEGADHRVGAEILKKIEGHVGGQVTVWNIDGTFYAGVVPA